MGTGTTTTTGSANALVPEHARDDGHEAHADEVWRVVLPRLWRYARSRRMSPEDASDAVQEAVARAIANAVPYKDAEDLLRWCQRVVTNIGIDQARRRKWLAGPLTHEVPDPADLLVRVEAQQLLRQVCAELHALPPGQREAILEAAQGVPAQTRREQNRQSKARERGRAALRRSVGGLLGLAAGAYGLLRRSRGALVLSGSAGLAAFAVLVFTLPAPATAQHDPLQPGLALPAHPKSHAGPARPATIARPVPVRPLRRSAPVASAAAVPQGRTLIEHRAPLGVRAGASQRDATPDDPLLCVGGGPVRTPVCLG